MRISLFAAFLATSTALVNVAAVAQPSPQLKVDDLVTTFVAPPAVQNADPANAGPPLNPDGCPVGFEATQTGECEPLKEGTLGFNLGKGSDAPRTAPRSPESANPLPAIGLNISLPPSSPPRTADLLLTFQTNSAELTAQAIANAQVFAAALNDPRLSGARFEIEGHTDASGAHDYNMALSQRRAEAVKQFLVSQGIAPDKLIAIGYGFTRLANGANPLSSENRRVVARRVE
jgi:outer membrane protein OmpA-like peptidoglycan-associated protein